MAACSDAIMEAPVHAPCPDCPASPLQALYLQLTDISRTMLAAARRGDWDALTEQESACAQLVGQLRHCPIETCPPAERQACMGLIREILANDAATRDIAEPRMKELGQMLRPRRNPFGTQMYR
ncbi:flagellar biosynthesis protein FliT [Pigmentiphaga humi]|uniref:Flagellar protein FliT n=1 Tax=Pigmentiphaga humi TaxID=2478468 RepID=A0A3P4B0V5_9BURK|nr:flagellar protein FliT [Pigmentiphaga humi]VCU69929.1 flagellar biosynthesis protein FliT [Pigmentiphaga humi]